jgi:hypothetical protein
MSRFLRAVFIRIVLSMLVGCGGGGDGGDSGGASPAAGDSGVEAPAAAPGFVALGSSASTVSLGWTAVAGASGYTVERKSGAGAYAPVATLGADAVSFLDDGLEKNTTYAYRLRVAGTPRQAEQTATTLEAAPVVTAAGAPKGSASSTTIGINGGRVVSADGTVTVDVPAGALAHDTELRWQPMTNTAPDGQGDGVHVQLDGALAKPLTLTMTYPEALAPNADGLGVALQRADGSWVSLPVRQVDKTLRALSVQLDGLEQRAATRQAASARAAASVTLDFRVVLFQNFYLSPREATVEVGRTQLLVPHAHTKGVIGTVCVPDPEFGCLPMPIIGAQEIPFDNTKAGYTRKWFVFAEEGGDAASGTVTPRGTLGAIYKAPGRAPSPNPVLVSFTSVHDKSGRSVTVTSKITVKEPVWTGILHGTLTVPGGDIGFSFSAEAVWTLAADGDGARFVASGPQSVSVIPFTWFGTASPASAALPPGALVIDRSVSPARYTLDVGSTWHTRIAGTCPGHGSATVGMDVPGRLVVEGTLSGDGTAINGSTVLNGVVWEWALTSQL